MGHLGRLVGAVPLLLAAGFCAFGFLSGFEPGADPSHLFKAAYGVAGIGFLGASGWLLNRR